MPVADGTGAPLVVRWLGCSFVVRPKSLLRGWTMRNRLGRMLAAGATATCLGAAGLQAATLEAVQGQVLVNKGSGYQFVIGSAELRPGDMVIANAGASAHVTYADGCVVPIEAGSVTTVGPRSPCTAQGGGSPSFGLSPGTLGIGTAAIGAGVGIAALLGSGGDKPASP